ncbi:Ig-like domain-containing protein [Acinetobacter lanii]|uniref:Bacterial Ig domain-containing protein n=1 Tax=Acinetobacter lanii TaxID=2715163 RepID=A0A6G8S3H7_9GAMM|nr:Ig-like domain-containing protein [Acinetobacter lanii]QIO08707.1 hypothetical protein G8D99_06530 [Acinetobacter lanii]
MSKLFPSFSKNNQTLTGKTEAGAIVTASFNGQVIGTAVADQKGKYSLQLDNAYLNGEEIKVVAQDSSGNSSVAHVVKAKDKTAPTLLTEELDETGQLIKGVSEAGATITATLNGKVIGKGIADDQGAYQLTLNKAYVNGETIQVTAKDQAGNTMSPHTVTTLDITAPTQLSQSISKDNQTVTGKTEAGATVIASFNGQVIGTAVADQKGKYSLQLDKAYLNGEEIKVVAQDSSGNSSVAHVVKAKDKTAPTLLTEELDETGQLIKGVSEAGATITATLNGKVIGKGIADDQGAYQLTLNKAYVNGETIQVTAKDQAGNTMSPHTVTTLDITAPTQLSQSISKDNQTVTGKTEAGATVIASFNGQVIGTAVADQKGKYSLQLDKAYLNGEEIKVVAQDSSGNSSVAHVVKAKDKTAPTLLTEELDETGQLIKGVSEAGATITATLNGKVIGKGIADDQGAYQLTLNKAYVNGETIQVTAKDQAGNTMSPHTVTTLDITAPTQLSQSISKDNQTVTGKTEAGATVIASFNGQVIGTAVADQKGKYSLQLDKAYLNGEEIKVVAQDQSGNSSVAHVVKAKDKTAPTVLTEELDETGQLIKGVSEAGATITATLNGKVIGKGIADDQGVYQLNLNKIYNHGETIYVAAKDKAGNASKSHEIKVFDIDAPDTTAPESLTQELGTDNQTITGSTEKSATITVSHDGKVVGTAVADANGKYSVSLDKAYNNGEKLEVVAKDQAGNATQPNQITAPDTTAPSSLTQAISTDGQTIIGSTESGATVTAMYEGKVVGTAVAGTDGHYTLTLNPAFTNGESIQVTATDKVNNSTQPTTITAPDTTAPAALMQELGTDNQTITGSTEKSATITVSHDGKVVGTAVADANGKYSVSLDKAYNNGEKLEVVAKDQAGNATQPNQITAPDTTAPSSLTQAISTDGQTIIGSTESGATVTAMYEGKVVGTAVAGTDGHYTLTLNPAFTNGESLQVTATDKVNNSTQPTTITAPDTTAPESLTQELGADNRTITGSTEKGATITVSHNGKVVGTAVADANGQYSLSLDKAYSNVEKLEVIAKDAAHNSTAPITIIAPDTTAPIVFTQVISKDGQTITGSTEAGATVTAEYNGKVVGTATAGTDGHYTLSLTPAFSNGESLRVTATDKVNNSTQPTTITAPDTTAPATLTQELDTDNQTMTGSTEQGATVTVSHHGKVVGTAVADANGQYSLSLDKAYNNGEKLAVTAQDPSDNALTHNLYAPMAEIQSGNIHFALSKHFITHVDNQTQTIDHYDLNSSLTNFNFEVTGNNGLITVDLTNNSRVIQGSYTYTLSGNGRNSSGSSSISSVGSTYKELVIAENLSPGFYSLKLNVNSSSMASLNIQQDIEVTSLTFNGYEVTTGNIFIDSNGIVSAPENYILKLGNQEVSFDVDKGNIESLVYETEHGYLTLNADGSYTYESNWAESSVDEESLHDQLNIEIMSMDGETQGSYQIDITPDINSVVIDELNFNEVEDADLAEFNDSTDDSSFEQDFIWDYEAIFNQMNVNEPLQFSMNEDSLFNVLNVVEEDSEDSQFNFTEEQGVLSSIDPLLVNTSSNDIPLSEFLRETPTKSTALMSNKVPTVLSNYENDLFNELLTQNTTLI